MAKIKTTLSLLVLVIPFTLLGQSSKLNSIINKYESHKGYDKKEYPLGLYTEEYYNKESLFAESLLNALMTVKTSQLTENERISLEILQFKLQETVDYYKFKAYLNPLLSDSGFHLSLSYHVNDINTYKQAKLY